MKRELYFAKMAEIFATFSKKLPELPLLEAIWRRVEDFPDAFMDFALLDLQDQEKLPANLGRYFVQELKPEFDRRTSIDLTRPQECPECGGIDGHIHAYGRDGYPCCYRCICSGGNWTRARILASGGSLIDPAYERLSAGLRNEPHIKKWLESLGNSYPVRERHEEYMASLEEQDW